MKKTLFLAPVLMAVALSITTVASADAIDQSPSLAALCQKDATKCQQARQRLATACARSQQACDKARARLEQRANGSNKQGSANKRSSQKDDIED